MFSSVSVAAAATRHLYDVYYTKANLWIS